MSITLEKIKLMALMMVLTLLGGASSSWAAGEILVWQFQHSLAGIQEAKASAVDSQGNLIITGYTNTGVDDDFYTIKIKSDGQTVLWATRYSHPEGDDWTVAVAVDSNDDVVITGYVANGINTDIAVIKYDGATGAQKWATPYVFNGAANGNDMPKALALDTLNNIYIVGYSQNGGSTADDGLLFKLSPDGPNPDGTPIWQAQFNGAASGDDRFYNISAGVDGISVAGYTAVMHSGSRLDFDFLTVKFDYSGAIVWQKAYDNGTEDDLAYYTGMDQEGNVIVTGEVLSGSRHDMHTIKYAAADGQALWSTTYSGGSPNIPKGLVVDNDGEIYLAGNTFTIGGKDDFYTARYAGANGVVVWEQVFNSGADNADIPHALAIDHTGGLYVTGYTHKATTGDDDFQTIKYNKTNGNQIWQQAQDGPPVGGNEQPVGVAVALAVTADGNIYVGGWSQQAIDDLDYFAVKYSADLLNAATGLTATVISQTRIDLAWQDNASVPNEDNFCIERCQGFGCSDFAELTCSVPQDQTTYIDTSVIKDNWYSYRITAKSTAKGYSLPSDQVSALTTVINYPAPDWLYTHDGEGLDDMANAIAMGSDNNPVATGITATANSQHDYYTIKLDRSNAATPYWIADYDGPDGQGDMGVCLVVDSNDKVVVSGFSSVDSGQGFNTNDIFTIKYEATGPDPYSGDPLWTSQYSGPGNDDDRAIAVASATDGSDYTVVTGYGKNASGNDDIYLIKYKPSYDAANQTAWTATPLDRGFNDHPATTAFTPAGNIVVVGTSERAANDSDIFISLYRGSDGAVMNGWPYVNDFGYGIDGINAVAVAPDNSIYVAGYTKNAAGNLDIYVNKFSVTGISQWGSGKITDGDGHGYDEAKAIAIDPNDGDIVVAATVTSASGSQDFHILRYAAADGTLRWRKTLDLIANDEQLTAMAMSPSGEICLVGITDDNIDTDVIAVKYDHLGNLIGSTRLDRGFDDYASGITVNRLGEFYIAGYSATGELATDDYDFVVFRFNGQELQAPSPFTATPHNTSADLNWTENDDTISGYKIYRKTGACTGGDSNFTQSNLIHTAPQGEINFTDNGLNIGSSYCYGLQAYRLATNDISRIIERQITTTTPIPPDNLVATIKNTSAVEVCWRDNSDSEDGFAVQRCTGVNCDFSQFTTLFAPAELDPAAPATCLVDTSACDSGSGKNFRYRVQSYKVNAWTSGFASQTDTMTVPDLVAPSSLSATRVAEAKVALLWTDNTVDESDLMLERCQGAGCTDFAEVGSVNAVNGNALLLEMDEAAWNGTPGQILDYSGKSRHGTAFAGATTSADAHGGRSGSLNGSNHYITAPLAIDQSAQSAGVTMMAWVKPSSISAGQHYLFSTEDGTTSAIRNSWGLLRDAGTWSVATGEAVRSTGVAVTSGQWQHIAVVFTPGVGVRFYKNGVETPINFIGNHDTSANVTIGRQGVLNQNFFDGLTDEVAVYDHALSAAEVQKLYTNGIFPETTGQKWFTDSTVSANLTYQYRVKSRKQTDCGTVLSSPSNVIDVTTAPLAPQPVAATLIKPGVVNLTWTPQTTTHTGFQVERCNGSGCTNFAVVTSTLDASAIKFTDTTACYGSDGILRYQIRALGTWGQSPPSAVAQVTSVPGPAPAGLTVSQATEGGVKLSWTSADSNRDGFIVERCSGTQVTCSQSNAFTPVAGSPLSGQDPSLQALWRMDDSPWNGTVGEVTDSSGKNHPGTTQNGVSLDSPGASSSYGTAVFDGANDYIDTNVLLDQSNSTPGATFMAWVYPVEDSYRYKYVFSTNNGGTDWGLSLYGTSWYVDTGYSTYWIAYATMNTWQHISVVYDPNAGVTLYINGVKQYSTVAYIDYDASSNPVTLGRDPVAGNYFTGKIDEVAVFSRVFNAQEVSQYYNRTTAIPFTDTSGISTGGTYTYRVTSFTNNTCGDWGPSSTPALVTASTPAAPVAPDTLTVNQKSSTELALTWHSNTTTESGFEIERCLGASCDFSTHDTFLTAAGVMAYNDTSVCQGQSYRYRVKAVQGTQVPWTWETAFSPIVTKATTAASAVALSLNVVSESEIGISWNDVNQDEDSYELARCQFEAGVTACDQPAQFTVLDTFPGTVSGAQLQYRMDEAAWTGAGSEVQDASGNNRHGTSYNGANTVVTGRFGRAGSFNGTTQYVATTLSVNQSPSSPGVTMEAWVYPTMTDGNPRSVLSTENGGADWGIIVQNGKWYVNTGLSQKDTGLTVDLNTWQHVTAVFTPQSGIKFYKNGTVAPISEIDYDLMTNPLNIGRNASTTSSSYYFQGKIDEVLVYGRPLSESEVTAHNTYQERTLYSYNDTPLQHSSTYHYRVIGRKAAGCNWSKETTASAATPAPPAPTNLIIANSTSTSVDLSWQDNNGSETGYVVSRCEGGAGNCASPTLSALPPNSQTFSDETLCGGQTYTYRVWAEGAWGQTAFAEKGMTTANPPSAPTDLTVNRISEVELAVAWNFSAADETHVKLERCIGASCITLDLPPAATSYDDNELQPNTEYCYRVSAYKTASCGWETVAAGPICATTSLDAGTLSATPVNTTTVTLAWSDTTQTETASVAERCDGDLATCCNNNPASCPGTFTPVGGVGINQNTFSDTSACAGEVYTYRVNTKGEGLSQANGGCWTKRAPLTFTSFPAFAGVEVTIPYQSGMRADFADLRFYDTTAHRELQYWLKQKTDSTSATVWLMTGAHSSIFLYYGNPSAGNTSGSDSMFTEVYDEFPGTTINPEKWVVIDPPADKISQNNGLLFSYKNSTQDAAVFSTKTFERATGNELFIDFTVGADTSSISNETIFMGWEHDQVAVPTWSGNATHLLNLTSNSNHYLQYVYENNTSASFTKILYDDRTRYQMKILLNANSGAKYYLRGGVYPDWRLLVDTTTVRPNDDVMRIAFFQTSHNLTIHQVSVKHASAQRGASINFAAAEGNGVACLTFSHTWTGIASLAAQAQMDSATAPNSLSASAGDGVVTLVWTPGTGDESEFRIERDCGSGYSQIGTSPGNTATYQDSTMPHSTSCSYLVKGHKEAPCPWTSAPSAPAEMLAPPAGPTVSATAENAFQVRLDWNDAADEESYEVEAQVFSGTWMPVAIVPANQLTYTDSHGVNPGTQYTYRVRARRAADTSSWGSASATTPAYAPGAATCPLP